MPSLSHSLNLSNSGHSTECLSACIQLLHRLNNLVTHEPRMCERTVYRNPIAKYNLVFFRERGRHAGKEIRPRFAPVRECFIYAFDVLTASACCCHRTMHELHEIVYNLFQVCRRWKVFRHNGKRITRNSLIDETFIHHLQNADSFLIPAKVAKPFSFHLTHTRIDLAYK